MAACVAVKITHAVKVAERLLAPGPNRPLLAEEVVAIQVLVRLVKGVLAARSQIRRLADLVDPGTHLNQQAMFDEPANTEKTDE